MSDKPHEFASTHVALPAHLGRRIRAIAALIPDGHLGADGREDDPHVTLKYGLHANNSGKARSVLQATRPIAITLGKTSIFPPSESSSGDAVLKVDVESEDLHRINGALAKAIAHTDSHPTYHPHVTIAYVKPEHADQYVGLADVDGQTATIDHVVFSGKDGHKVSIPLSGQKQSS